MLGVFTNSLKTCGLYCCVVVPWRVFESVRVLESLGYIIVARSCGARKREKKVAVMMDNHKDWNNRGVEDAPSSPRSTRVPSQVVTNGARPSSLKKLRSQRNKSGLAISENFYKQHMQLSRALNSKSSADNNSSKNSLGPMSMENSRRSMESSRQSLEQHHDDDVDEYQLDDDVDDQEFPYSRWTSIIDTIQTFRYHCGVFVNHKNAQFFVVYLIAINAIMMGIGTFDFVTDNPDVENIFELIDLIFLIIFTIELGMQFCFYGWRMILDGWLIFDTIIIIMSWSFSQVQIIRAFRIFRAFRLITRIKVLKNLVLALFGVMPRMFAIGLLLTLVSYIFAVMFTQLFKDLYEDGQTTENYFGRMDHTLCKCFTVNAGVLLLPESEQYADRFVFVVVHFTQSLSFS